MKLLVIRHAIAQEQDEWANTGATDDLRPLTDKGRKRMERTARGLAKVAPRVQMLASSPYTRAVQTAEIVGPAFDDPGVVIIDQLIPEHPLPELLEWLKRLDDIEVAAVVGHEPHLGMLISWLLTGNERGLLELKKGGAVMLEFNGTLEAGQAKLLWAMTPKQLRRLA